jgi:hypothetical protein
VVDGMHEHEFGFCDDLVDGHDLKCFEEWLSVSMRFGVSDYSDDFLLCLKYFIYIRFR